MLFIGHRWRTRGLGSTGVTLTGQLGDVMKESAQIALSYLRSHGAELELPVGDLKDRGVHVHVFGPTRCQRTVECGRHDDDRPGARCCPWPTGPV